MRAMCIVPERSGFLMSSSSFFGALLAWTLFYFLFWYKNTNVQTYKRNRMWKKNVWFKNCSTQIDLYIRTFEWNNFLLSIAKKMFGWSNIFFVRKKKTIAYLFALSGAFVRVLLSLFACFFRFLFLDSFAFACRS